MPNFSSLKQLEAYLQQKINEALQNEVADTVRETEAQAIQSVVYDSYSPSLYIRRQNNGGISDQLNMDANLESDGILSVTNNTIAHPTIDRGGQIYDSKNKGKLLTLMVVAGGDENYDFPSDPYSKPRDFIQATKDKLENSQAHIEALKKGLAKRGVHIE